MPLLKRKDIAGLLESVKQGDIAPVYLLFGERYLCRDVANQLIQALLPDGRQQAGNLQKIDGDREDPAQTLNLLRTYSLFGGRQVIRVMDSKLFYSKDVAKTFWDKGKRATDAGDFKQAARRLGQMLAAAGMAPDDWDNEDMAALSGSRWQSLFGFAKPEDIGWVQKTLEKGGDVIKKPAPQKNDAAELFTEALEAGIPSGNTMILMTEAVDKRKRLYKYLGKHGVVIDLAVDSGSSSAARKGQEALLKELVRNTLASFRKKMEPQALATLLERVGFHPVAAVMETEKLALYVGDAPTITTDDLNAVVGRTREEALYEFTEAFGNKDLQQALRILSRLRGNGVHPLMIIAGLRNYVRKLLLARAFQEQPRPSYSSQSYGMFQKGYLEQLKAVKGGLPALLAGHPYVVYKTFRQAEKFSVASLKYGLAELLKAEYRLKGSNVPDYVTLENLLFTLFVDRGREERSVNG